MLSSRLFHESEHTKVEGLETGAFKIVALKYFGLRTLLHLKIAEDPKNFCFM